MSSEHETDSEGTELRGEVLLVGFVNKALDDKTQGHSQHYDTLVQSLAASANEPSHMRKYLLALRNSISRLTEKFDSLVGAALSLPWSDQDEETVDLFVDFLEVLVSSQTYYLHACLRMLVKSFLPVGINKETSQDDDMIDQHYKRHHSIHQGLHAVLAIAPMAHTHLLPILKQYIPYLKKPLPYQEMYIKNLLEITKYAPSLHKDILEIICGQLLKLDVEIPKHELEKPDEETTQFDVELEQDEKESDDREGLGENPEEDENQNTSELTNNNEMAERLDFLMMIMFDYIRNTCYHNGIYTDDAASNLFDKLSEVFFKVILPTHLSCHIQFLMFYFCSFEETFVNTFLELCWTKFQDVNTPQILRQISAAYIGSFVARAKYISRSVMATSLKLLINWIHNYIDTFDNVGGRCNINKHGHFYSLCQATFYIFIFCHKELLEEEAGLNFVRQLNFERVVTCRLNPLKACLPTVVNMFAAVTRVHEIVFCYTIIERNNRATLPVATSTFSTSVAKVSVLNQLDAFFPFDPFLLKRSRKCITSLYREWEGVDPSDDKDSSDDEVKEGSSEHGITADSLTAPSWNSCGIMSMSPGFSKV